MGTEQLTPVQIIQMYDADTKKLKAYLPALYKLAGQNAANTYDQNGLAEHSMTFPVYDSNLLAFIRHAEGTVFMNRNYRYSYTRLRIRTPEDELKTIENCTIQQMNVLGDILSKYVLGGRTKAVLWSQAAKLGIFTAVIEKADELIHFWETNKE